MQIKQIPQNTRKNTNFCAIKIANTQALINKNSTNIELYRLGFEDKGFLHNLLRKIKISKLYPKLSKENIERWQRVFDYSISKALDNENTTYIAINKNKPCGILTFFKDSISFLDGVCSIPIGYNQKVPFVGQTLIYQMFKDVECSRSKAIKLKAVNDGPFNVVKKYEKLGFKQEFNKEVDYTEMSCNKHKIAHQLKELPFIIKYDKCEQEKVNLNKFLD